VSYEQWTNIKIMEIIFNCIPTGTLGAVGQMRLNKCGYIIERLTNPYCRGEY
jgi:hypothetical protein